jgi:hypothetical protein
MASRFPYESDSPGESDYPEGGVPPENIESPISNEPTARLGFELKAVDSWWSFVPNFYPNVYRQTKDRELDRSGRPCGGEDISIKKIKNRQFHITGVLLASEIPIYQKLMDYQQPLDLISPLTPHGGMEVHIKKSELGEWAGWDPVEQEHMFEYKVDLVSTGRDEYDIGNNPIVSEIIDPEDMPSELQQRADDLGGFGSGIISSALEAVDEEDDT